MLTLRWISLLLLALMGVSASDSISLTSRPSALAEGCRLEVDTNGSTIAVGCQPVSCSTCTLKSVKNILDDSTTHSCLPCEGVSEACLASVWVNAAETQFTLDCEDGTCTDCQETESEGIYYCQDC
ncbi:MAG: hypothetical protein DWQ01_08820 [Planctomycetota bacterium]|nr:MAG: hypothetical protein DWQ01_08820 [Planctomycetota bacterium]